MFLVHVIYYFYLTKINYLFLFHVPAKFMINKEKNISQWWWWWWCVCVCCIMSCSEIFFSQDGVFLVTNHGGDLW